MSTTKQTNKELFRRSIESLNNRDQEAFADTHTEDVVLHDHEQDRHGIEAAIEEEWTLYDASPIWNIR